MAKRAKKQEEHVNHERWLITYADLITLLLVFFIIMYAMSKIDVSKYEILAKSLNFQFAKADTLLPKGKGVSGQITPKNGDSDAQDKEYTKKNIDSRIEQNEKDKKEKELQDLLKTIQTYVNENNLQTQVSATDTDKGVAITLNDLFLFDLGKADLKKESYPILNKLSTLFPSLNSEISIEGHTDSSPLATGSAYRDNWGLSNARSLSVLWYFKYNAGLDDSKFISTGYGDTKPVALNDTAENRAKNRRVEIIVLRDNAAANSKDPAPLK